MRTRWIVWGTVTALFTAFALAGWVAETSVTKPIMLARGSTVDVTLLRLVAGPLQAELSFARNGMNRPELGETAGSGNWRQTGVLRHANPGAPVRLTATFSGSDPIPFEAMPKSGYSAAHLTRELTTNLSIEPGVWRWPPPDDPRSRLAAGFTTIRFEVVAVDDRLNGEMVELTVVPQLGKRCQPGVCWLGGWILWPVFAVFQAGWGGVLLLIARRSRARSTARSGTVAARSIGGDHDV